MRAWYESLAQKVSFGLVVPTIAATLLYLLRTPLHILNAALGGVPLLLILAAWLPHLHPWWGFYQELRGIGNNWLYVGYVILVTLMIWGRLLRRRSFKKAGKAIEPSGAGQGDDA